LLEGRGARTALVSTRGFADLIEIGRQDRPKLYHPCVGRPEPLVDRELRFEAAERVSGERVLEGLSDAEVERLVGAVRDSGVESVAVCLLFSFGRAEHRERVAAGV